MSLYQIEIDDNKIKEQMNFIIDDIFKKELNRRYTDTQEVIALAVKDLVYSRKDEIIEKVVERASKEIVKKGLPKLLATITKEGD